MAGWVGKHSVAGLGRVIDVFLPSQQTRARLDRPMVRRRDVVDRQVDMDLLRLSSWPLRRHMTRGELDSQHRRAVDSEYVVPFLPLQAAAEQVMPETTLCLEFRGVEHDGRQRDCHIASVAAGELLWRSQRSDSKSRRPAERLGQRASQLRRAYRGRNRLAATDSGAIRWLSRQIASPLITCAGSAPS